jgi:RNA polymerase sigma-70 factor, ECF subfamily
LNTIYLPRSRVNSSEGDEGPPAARPGDHACHRARPVAQRAGAYAGIVSRSDPPLDEAELVRRLAKGDAGALTIITDWLWQPLAAYAFRIVDDQDVAMDIAQEACVRLWQGRDRTPPNSLRPYLYRIARNLALDHLKTRRSRFRLLNRQRHRPVRRTVAPDEVLERERVSAIVQRAIQEMPDRRREVFTLTYLRGLSYAEVGAVMGISPKTVQNQMTAALAYLRKTLRPLIDERNGDQTEATQKDTQ